jgi:hypothetical protein
MRILVIASALAALAIPATGASAQWGNGYNRGYGNGYRNNTETAQEIRECRRELRSADSRREYYRERRECQREIADARRDDARRGYGRYGAPYGNAWGYRDRRHRDDYRWRFRR